MYANRTLSIRVIELLDTQCEEFDLQRPEMKMNLEPGE